MTLQHLPVLLDEVIDGLNIRPGSCFIDCTIGGGGHTEQILQHSAPTGRVLGIDADPEAISRVHARQTLAVTQQRLLLKSANFGEVEDVAQELSFFPVDGVLLDIGVSSFQLDTPARGFSFLADGPLDMRMDPTQSPSAADIVNSWAAQELADAIFQYGEERKSRRIARAIVNARPITTTGGLARVVEQAVGGRRGQRLHPATRTFQALRIVVNNELNQLICALPACLELLKPGGRIAVISFHSLEDRIVKQWMRQEALDYIHDSTHPLGGYSQTPSLRLITRKPIIPQPAEIKDNPRSRSAKLRIAEKL